MLTLIRWQLKQLFWINLIALIYFILMTLYKQEAILFARSQWLMLGVFLHCCGVALIAGRSSPRGSGFLYSQGFSRDQLWWANFLASLMSGVFVCLLIYVVIATGFRAAVQSLHGNPWAPVMGSIELSAIKWIALEYLLLFALFHYVWVRARQPARDSAAGWMIAIAMTSFVGVGYERLNGANATRSIMIASFALGLALLFVIANWKFHRSVEVQA